jgi:4-hydroxy-tetrahydrodipicolinate synthase
VLFKGSIVALVTPMQADGSIDEVALRRLIDWHLASGTHGVVVMGTTGESSLVSDEEHCQVVAIALEQAQKRMKVIAGCGGISTDHVIKLVEKINHLPVDGYLCVTPYYIKPTQKGLIAHFTAIADACKAPLILYNVPGRTACDLKNETVATLARHPNIVAIKDATGDMQRAAELMKLVGDGFGYLSGDDATALEFMRLGGHGVISVTANLAPVEFSRWCELMLRQDPSSQQAASEIYDRFSGLNEVLFVEANPIPVKWALVHMNKINDRLRLPLTSAEDATKIKITQALHESAIS